MAKTDIKTASVLAFERKLDPSDAMFSAGRWEKREEIDLWSAIAVREKSVRGTISNRLKTKDQDPAKLDAAIENPNLQTVDVAMLPNDSDTLKVRFTLRILGDAGKPSTCNNSEYKKKLLETVESYVKNKGFNQLAQRYAMNLANGRFLWRNRMGAEAVEIRVHQMKDGKHERSWTFDAFSFSLRDFTVPMLATDSIKELTDVIKTGLAGDNFVLLDVEAFVRAGEGQEVFPSQELILERGVSKKGQKSKTLYTVSGIAGMHSQKIGNALRTIDTWYSDDAGLGPIAVEPYGSVTSQGKAYRQPKEKLDFYSLLDNWVLKDQVPAEDQQHYVIANLIRGGVFGESEKD